MQRGQPPIRSSAPTFWINHVSRMVMHRFDDRLRPLGFSMASLRVAVALEEHGSLQQKALLEHVAIEQPTMTALVTRMERDRLLVRRPDPTDARARLISLTPHASTVLTKARTVMQDVVEEAMTGVSKHDREKLIETLQVVARNLADESVERLADAASNKRPREPGSPRRRGPVQR